MALTLALFDMAATTVDDTIDGCPLVLQSFADSFNTVHVPVSWEVLNAQRGKDKLEVFRTLLASHGGLHEETLEQTAQGLLAHFTAQLLRNVARLREMPGATAAFRFLKHHGVFIALGSGFPAELPDYLVKHGYVGAADARR